VKLPAYKLLSKEQDRINSLPLNGSYVVAGPPGTGKTVVALYRASMVQKQGQTVQMLTYSKVLTTYLSEAVKDLKLSASVKTYHQWVEQQHRSMFHGLSAPKEQGSKWDFDWDKILERCNCNPPKRGSLPHLIVDEGQDFPKKFFLLSQYLASNTTIFADENQTLFKNNSKIREIKAAAGVKNDVLFLRKNYRNTRQIATLAGRFHSGLETGIPELPDRLGPPIVLKRHAVVAQSVDMIVRYHKLKPATEVGVLLPTKALVKSYVGRLKARVADPSTVQFYYRDDDGPKTNLDFRRNAIRVLTYPSAKGLDFDAVFLPDIQEYSAPAMGSVQMQWYVLLSRARENLYIYYRGDETELITTLRRYINEDAAAESGNAS
jgi:DNA helicase IV